MPEVDKEGERYSADRPQQNRAQQRQAERGVRAVQLAQGDGVIVIPGRPGMTSASYP